MKKTEKQQKATKAKMITHKELRKVIERIDGSKDFIKFKAKVLDLRLRLKAGDEVEEGAHFTHQQAKELIYGMDEWGFDWGSIQQSWKQIQRAKKK